MLPIGEGRAYPEMGSPFSALSCDFLSHSPLFSGKSKRTPKSKIDPLKCEIGHITPCEYPLKLRKQPQKQRNSAEKEKGPEK
jgi:hypothetical protein